MALLVDLDHGDIVQVGDVRVRVERKSGSRVRLAVDAPRAIPIEITRDPQERAAKHPAHECPESKGTHHGKHPVRQRPPAVS